MPFMSLHCLDHYVFSSHGNLSFFLYSNFKSIHFLFQEHAGIKRTSPAILSTQTLDKHKHLETGKKSLHFLVCNPIKLILHR